MAGAAQVVANRSNAQKSTGPRTPEGKAAVAQNAVRHGLLAQEVVIKGEDPEEFELYRDGMLAELAPAGPMESMLAERIVGLSWRLRRAERLQAAAFDKVEEKNEPLPVLDPEDASWLLEQIAERGMRIPAPVHEGPAFGRRAVQDFNQERVLDRLLMYERRIEHSLYRTMAELRNLRRLRAQNPLRAGATAVRSVPVRAYQGVSSLTCEVSREQSQASSPPTPNFPLQTSPETPDGVTTNGAEAQGQACETNPIPGGAGDDQVPCGEKVEEVGRGRPTYEEGSQTRSVAFESPETPDGVTTNRAEAQGQACETKPICASSEEDQVPCCTKVEEVGRGRPTYEETRVGVSTNVPGAGEQACETKPISAGANKGQVGYRPIFRRRR